MLDLNFLGVGGAFSTSLGNNSAFIKRGNTLILLDCGSNIFTEIMKNNLLNETNKVYVVITHLHPDHVGSLGDLIYYTHFVKNINIKVYYPNNDICTFLRLQGLKEGIHYECYNIPLCPVYTASITDNNIIIKLSAIENEHDENIKSYGYSIKEYEKNIIVNDDGYENTIQYDLIDNIYYSGDSANINKYVFDNINDLTKIYHDASATANPVHISLQQLSAAIPLEIRNKFYLMHYSEDIISKIKQEKFNIVERS